MPIFSGGGGGGAPTGAAGGDLGGTYPNPTVDLMAGGTLTGPLAIAPTNHALTAETITMAAGALANGTDWLLVQNDNGDNVFEGDASGYLTIKTLSNGTGFRVVTSNGTAIRATPSATSVSGPAGGAVSLASDGGSGDMALFTGINAAPADGQLVATNFALWLDATNGACKLMVKAKQADGTVRTAAIALA